MDAIPFSGTLGQDLRLPLLCTRGIGSLLPDCKESVKTETRGIKDGTKGYHHRSG